MIKNTDSFERLKSAVEKFRMFLETPQSEKDRFPLVYQFALFRSARMCNYMFLTYVFSSTDFSSKEVNSMNIEHVNYYAHELGIVSKDDKDRDEVARTVSHACYYIPDQEIETQRELADKMPMVCAFFERVVQKGAVVSQNFRGNS